VIAAVRGWGWVVEHALIDWYAKAPSEGPEVARVEAAVTAGLVAYTPLRCAVGLTPAGEALWQRAVARYERRRAAGGEE
jgi:hypothetical protein